MARFKLTIEYAGGRYSGWQRQVNARTVQGELERAIAEAVGHDDFECQGSGRTDAGVHALMQVAHLEIALGDVTLQARDQFLGDRHQPRLECPASAGQADEIGAGVLTVRIRNGDIVFPDAVGCTVRVRETMPFTGAQLEVTASSPTRYRVTYRVPR